MGHSGLYDSHDSEEPPTMASCVGPYADKISLSQDDEIAAQFIYNTSGSYRAFTANPSFEEGTQYWGKTASINYFSTSTYGGGVDGSPTHLLTRSTSDWGSVFQTSRLATSKTDNEDTIVKARVNVRKHSDQNIGTVMFRHRYRTVTYSGTSGGGCQHPNNQNQNSDPSLGSWTWGASTFCAPTSASSWRWCTTSAENIGSAGAKSDWDFQVRVYPRMYLNAVEEARTYVRLDRTRVLVDAP